MNKFKGYLTASSLDSSLFIKGPDGKLSIDSLSYKSITASCELKYGSYTINTQEDIEINLLWKAGRFFEFVSSNNSDAVVSFTGGNFIELYDKTIVTNKQFVNNNLHFKLVCSDNPGQFYILEDNQFKTCTTNNIEELIKAVTDLKQTTVGIFEYLNEQVIQINNNITNNN